MSIMHIGDLHLNQLRLVDALVRSSNLSEAAEEIGLTQSAASHALARLREQVQDPIFVRTPRACALPLTASGWRAR
jgi:DNA-binding transcriptional LysR family regulator